MSPIIAMVVGFILVFWSISQGGSAKAFVDWPSVAITVGGSFTALLISYPMKQIKNIPRLLKKLISKPSEDKEGLLESIIDLSRTARSQGLLVLDSQLPDLENEFLVDGLKMVVDGMDAEDIREILETKVENMEERHHMGQAVFMKLGELAPAFGMIGTLIGLINMLGSLTDPSTIGSGMAVALLTTFYGSMLANLVFIPIAQNLKMQTEAEAIFCDMIIEGVLAIQSGQNPRVIEQKLYSYLSEEPSKEKIKKEDDLGVPQSEGQSYV